MKRIRKELKTICLVKEGKIESLLISKENKDLLSKKITEKNISNIYIPVIDGLSYTSTFDIINSFVNRRV